MKRIRRRAAGIGCSRCYGEDAERVWAYYIKGLVIEQVLADDSHFVVQLRRCADCSQQFVWIFTEAVDWDGGGDAQHRSVVPLSADEAQTLAAQAPDLPLRALAALGRDRRYLETDWPTGARKETVHWATGELRVG
jgi:hypothetical protein